VLAAIKPGPSETVRLARSFVLPVPPDRAFAVLTDAPRLATVVPGATLTRWDGTSFDATARIRLGLLPLVGHGAGRIVERDPVAHRVVVDVCTARGRWVAEVVAVVMAEHAGARTSRVDVVADLRVPTVAGRLGRSLVTDIGNRMVDQASAALIAELAAEAVASGTASPVDDESLVTRILAPAVTTAAGVTVAAIRFIRRQL
jgi:carbon-monoxide dehydrogenase small subunit